jgi:hypothetical protein
VVGIPLADPLIGLGIGVVITAIVGGGRQVWLRFMDATDPALTGN